MSFQYPKNDPRGKPTLKKFEGYWVFLYDLYTNNELFQQAAEWCEKMNKPFRSLKNEHP